ncbi:HopJ type III effector protein [Shewanella aestuarii]|uniref:HopJ type III effector protein n=1 Tax=Shewanella aestuarii TaxID=1028752 RepID=A0A6G9QLH4_9GAMM|nr:HopJ type III effector protein [Shewanella aestuarii]QIR15430.1 HopJ type III effector protein [Shewanella aestuarii]
MSNIADFIDKLEHQADSLMFEDFLALIDSHYDFSVTGFTNGSQRNSAGENSGSCKVFAFGLLQQLTQQQTLALFGQHYRDVLANPQANDHQNIRQFVQHGWDGIQFEQEPAKVLASKAEC